MVNELNAYKYSDNYRIETEDGLIVYGCEHNKEEADAIARYLANHHARRVVVRHNSKDSVRAAKKVRREPLRVQNREMILRDMGVWA